MIFELLRLKKDAKEQKRISIAEIVKQMDHILIDYPSKCLYHLPRLSAKRITYRHVRGILQQIDKLKSDLKKVVDEQTRKGSWNRLFRFCSEIEMVK